MASSVRSARCPDASSLEGGLYRPRSPRSSPLWQCAKRHAGELRAAGRVQRIVEQQVIERFIACGDPQQYVFTLPKLLRPIFSQHRAWLGELCHAR